MGILKRKAKKTDVPVASENSSTPTGGTPSGEVQRLKIACAGDFQMNTDIIKPAWDEDKKEWDFTSIFQHFGDTVRDCDLAIINLELPFGGGEKYRDFAGLKRPDGKPRFNVPDEALDEIVGAGFNFFLTSSNHVYDMGHDGLIRKQKILTERGFQYVGTKMNADDPDYTIVDMNGIKVGFLNYTRESIIRAKPKGFKKINSIEIPLEDQPLICSFDYLHKIKFAKRVEKNCAEMKQKGVDFILLFPHWADEFKDEVQEREAGMAVQMANGGVDFVVGGHPHVVLDFRMLDCDRDAAIPCLFSMGNLVSSHRQPDEITMKTRDGIIFKFTLEKANGVCKIVEIEPVPIYTAWEKRRNTSVIPMGNVDLSGVCPGNLASIEELEASRQRTGTKLLDGLRDAKERGIEISGYYSTLL